MIVARDRSMTHRALVAMGVHVASDGYPNVKFRLQALRATNALEQDVINFPFRRSEPPLLSRRLPKLAHWITAIFRLAAAHEYVLAAFLARGCPPFVYVPYPAVFVMFLMSLLPRLLRPRIIVADAFISLYDTVVTDRALLRANTLWARALKAIETRAYRLADLIIVDTDLNAQYFVRTFGLPSWKLLVVPLSIDEHAYRPIVYAVHAVPVRVIFLGTFVPLQGVDVIAQAAVLLAGRRDIEVTLIGDGQSAPAVAKILRSSPDCRVNWIREWQSPASLARAIADADICLGIFGSGEKTGRVWPFKNYAYMAVGRALITADTPCARELSARALSEPFVVVTPGSPEALAAAIIGLADRPDCRVALAHAARAFYEQHLAASISASRLIEALSGLGLRFDKSLAKKQ